MELRRLSGRKVCERVKTKGMLWKGKHVQARIMRGQPRTVAQDTPPALYVGVVTSAKLDKSAVRRNRMRRRCREALRLEVSESPKAVSAQLILLPRSSSLTAPFGELLMDARRLLSSLSA